MPDVLLCLLHGVNEICMRTPIRDVVVQKLGLLDKGGSLELTGGGLGSFVNVDLGLEYLFGAFAYRVSLVVVETEQQVNSLHRCAFFFDLGSLTLLDVTAFEADVVQVFGALDTLIGELAPVV